MSNTILDRRNNVGICLVHEERNQGRSVSPLRGGADFANAARLKVDPLVREPTREASADLTEAFVHRASTNSAGDLAAASVCPKFSKCSAAYCPALGPKIGGKHLPGEQVCSYLLESVKEGGPDRLRWRLSKNLADVVIREGLRLLNSAGPMRKALNRASTRGSRMESMAQASRSKGGRHD
jgi:hypothetical protein